MMAALTILYEDNHLLAVVKPVGLPTMGVAVGKPSLITLAREYVKQKYDKPGNVYLGIVSRLDSLTSGVVLLARTSKSAARLSEQFRDRTVEKTYWAIVEGSIPPSGQLTDWLSKNETEWKILVSEKGSPDAREARLTYRRLKQLPGASLVEVRPETGRKHQIRVQLAHHGFPVIGDEKYGSRVPFPAGIALHARALVVQHPISAEPVELIAPLPAAWKKFGVSDQT
jgi:23S rRNA pseudouridine1911/1915/1917 synthase